MLYLIEFNVKQGRGRESQAWLKKNDKLLQKYAPRGWKYRGTYGTVLGFGEYDGTQMWEASSYSDFDTWREHADPDWIRMGEEFQEFVVDGRFHSVLLREVADVKIIEAAKPRR